MCFCSTLVLFREMRPSVHPFLTLARARRTASAPRDLLDLWYRNSLHHPLICLHFLFLCVSSPDKAVFSEDRDISEMMMIKPDRSLLQWPYSFTFVLKHTEDVFFLISGKSIWGWDKWHMWKKKKKSGLGEKCQKINACRKNGSTDVLRRGLEYVGLVTSLSQCKDFAGFGALGVLELAPVVTLTRISGSSLF